MNLKPNFLRRSCTKFLLLVLLSFLSLSSYAYTVLPAQKFVIFTPPKCGTHLVCNVVGYMFGSAPLITDQLKEDILQQAETARNNNHFLVSHSFTTEMLEELVKNKYKIIFILRDPRDQLISMMYWMKKGYWNEFTVSKIVDRNEQIDELISGSIYNWRCYEGCIGIRMDRLKNLPNESVFTTRFESLVGAKGRGNQDLQINEIISLGKFLGFDLSSEDSQEIADHSFGGTWSFREGKIGSWKEHFLPYQIEAYKAIYSDLLIDLEYETTKDW